MSCFVMVSPFRPYPFRSSRRAAALKAANIADAGAAGPCFARNARGRARPSARVRTGAVRAPDCPRESQDAPLPCVSQRFFETGAAGRAAPGKRLRMPPLRVLYRYIYPYVKQYREQKVKISPRTVTAAPPPACPRISAEVRWGRQVRA